MAPHPLPSQPTLSSPQLIPKPQFTPRHPLLTPRPHQNSQPTLRHHHQPTHRILTNSNPRSTLSLSMTTTASSLPMELLSLGTSLLMGHHQPTTLLRHPTTQLRHPTTQHRRLTTPLTHQRTSTLLSRNTTSSPATASSLGTSQRMATLPSSPYHPTPA